MSTFQKFEVGTVKDVQKFNDWFEKCRLSKLPYVIVVRETEAFSIVQWDGSNLEPSFDRLLAQKAGEISNSLLNISMKYGNSKSTCTSTNLTFFVKNVSKESAESMAEDVFDYLNQELMNLRYSHSK